MGSEEEAYFTFVRESDNPFHQRTVFLSVEDLISSLLNKNHHLHSYKASRKWDQFIAHHALEAVESKNKTKRINVTRIALKSSILGYIKLSH